MARGDSVQRLAGVDHQHLHRLQTELACLPRFREGPTDEVEPFEKFEVGFQVIDEGAVKQMSADTRQTRRVVAPANRRQVVMCRVTDTDNQRSRCPQVQRRTDGSGLTYRAIAIVFAVQPDRREHQWNRRAGQQMLHPQPGWYPDATMAQPGIDSRLSLIKRHRLALG